MKEETLSNKPNRALSLAFYFAINTSKIIKAVGLVLLLLIISAITVYIVK